MKWAGGVTGTEVAQKSEAAGGHELGDICGAEKGQSGREVRGSNSQGKENGGHPCIRIRGNESALSHMDF